MIGIFLLTIIEVLEDEIIHTLKKIKSGNLKLKDELIREYKPFILKTISVLTGKRMEMENSEEISIGLIAFNEAIDSFDPEKNFKFHSFTRMVIKRRIIDYIRKSKNGNSEIPFSHFECENDNDFVKNFEERYLVSDSFRQYENIEMREEIQRFKENLMEFGITVRDLVSNAPKHKDSMKMIIKIARILAEKEDLYLSLHRKKTLPMVELLKYVDVSKRTVEKYRKFIIGICLILRSNLDILKSYTYIAGREGTI